MATNTSESNHERQFPPMRSLSPMASSKGMLASLKAPSGSWSNALWAAAACSSLAIGFSDRVANAQQSFETIPGVQERIDRTQLTAPVHGEGYVRQIYFDRYVNNVREESFRNIRLFKNETAKLFLFDPILAIRTNSDGSIFRRLSGATPGEVYLEVRVATDSPFRTQTGDGGMGDYLRTQLKDIQLTEAERAFRFEPFYAIDGVVTAFDRSSREEFAKVYVSSLNTSDWSVRFRVTEDVADQLVDLHKNEDLAFRFELLYPTHTEAGAVVTRRFEQAAVQTVRQELRKLDHLESNGKLLGVTVDQIDSLQKGLQLSMETALEFSDENPARLAIEATPDLSATIAASIREHQPTSWSSLSDRAQAALVRRFEPLINQILSEDEKADLSTMSNEDGTEDSKTYRIGGALSSVGGALSGGASRTVTKRQIERIEKQTGIHLKLSEDQRTYVPDAITLYGVNEQQMLAEIYQRTVSRQVGVNHNRKTDEVSSTWTDQSLRNILNESYRRVTVEEENAALRIELAKRDATIAAFDTRIAVLEGFRRSELERNDAGDIRALQRRDRAQQREFDAFKKSLTDAITLRAVNSVAARVHEEDRRLGPKKRNPPRVNESLKDWYARLPPGDTSRPFVGDYSQATVRAYFYQYLQINFGNRSIVPFPW